MKKQKIPFSHHNLNLRLMKLDIIIHEAESCLWKKMNGNTQSEAKGAAIIP